MSFLSSHVSQPTRHLQGTPLQGSNPFSTFWALLFGLGPAALPFHHTYLEYLRATNAMEHVLLAFVRWQDAPSNESSGSFGDGPGSAASLGVPTRLNDWIRGYPAMLPEPATRSRKHDRLQRRGARVSPFSSQTSDS